jgi:hypothetical protein
MTIPSSLRALAKQSRNFASDAIWIASAYAQGRFGGLQARHSSQRERRRVVAFAPPGIHFATSRLDKWIPDSRYAASGMTK